MCNQQSLRSACAYAQSAQSLCLSLEYSMTVKLQTEHHLGFLSLKRGCTGSTESTLVKMSNCWKSHDMAHMSVLHARLRNKFSGLNSDLFSNHIRNNPLCDLCNVVDDPYHHFFQYRKYSVEIQMFNETVRGFH